MTEETSFSKRYGYLAAREIVFRDDLSDEFRQPVIDILRRFTSTGFLRERIERLFNPYGLDMLPQRPGPIPLSEEENRPDFIEVKRVLLACEWFRLYDLIEDVFQQLKFHDEELADIDEEPQAYPFERSINEYFGHAGIGWQIVGGRVVARGGEAFESGVTSATAALKQSNRPTAARHLHDALQALSRRPIADCAGAIFHAMGALECVARDLAGDHKATLGEILKRRPDLLPKPLDSALSQIWGYSSNAARHVTEGRDPNRQEAELVVGLSAAVAAYLTRHGQPHA
jgi:AbiJ-like protein